MSEIKKNMLCRLTFTGYSAEGAGVARLEGLVVFVPGVIRGEEWEVQLLKVGRQAAWGRALRPVQTAPCRISPDCPLSGSCGGCQFRHMEYAEELQAKRRRVEDALERIGGVTPGLPSVLGAEQPLRYRNKVQFPVAPGRDGRPRIGFYRTRSHDVLDAEDCLLQPPQAALARQAVLEWMERFSVPAYDEGTGSGLVRHLYLRFNRAGQTLCCLVINGKQLPHARGLVELLQERLPGLAGVVVNTNTRDTNVILGDRYTLLWGQDFLEEELCGLTFRLSVPSFFQVNPVQTEKLYATALEFAQLTGGETAVDLYCGIGTISLCLARRAGRVIGGEIVPQAVEDARENARRNGVTNAEFFCGDAGAVARRLAEEGIRPQVVCVDPPRKGLGEEVPGIIAGMAPERIVYVSCDPGTLARDVKRFAALGYRLEKARAVDLFPRTAHVETVCLLSKLGVEGDPD